MSVELTNQVSCCSLFVVRKYYNEILRTHVCGHGCTTRTAGQAVLPALPGSVAPPGLPGSVAAGFCRNRWQPAPGEGWVEPGVRINAGILLGSSVFYS